MKRFCSKRIEGLAMFMLGLALVLIPAQALAFGHAGADYEAAADISDSEIEAFVRVQTQIIQIQQEYNNRITAAADEGQQQQIIEEANREMIGVIESEGISIERYNEILTQAQDDPQVMQQIERAAQEFMR